MDNQVTSDENHSFIFLNQPIGGANQALGVKGMTFSKFGAEGYSWISDKWGYRPNKLPKNWTYR